MVFGGGSLASDTSIYVCVLLLVGHTRTFLNILRLQLIDCRLTNYC